MNTIGERIKQKRNALGLSQQDVGTYVGVSRSAVSMWETGDSKGLKPESLVLAAEVLKTTEKWLVFGTNDKDYLDGEVIIKAIECDTYQKSGIKLVPNSQSKDLAFIDFSDLSTFLNSNNKNKEFKTMAITKNVSVRSFAVLITSKEHEPYITEGEVAIVDPTKETLTKTCLVEMNGQFSFMRHVLTDKEYFIPCARGMTQIEITESVNYKIIGVCAFIVLPYREG